MTSGRTLRGRVLIVAGSDPGGGAGVQGDIKTVTVLGGYAMAAITALTIQDTRGVGGVHFPPSSFVSAQVRTVLADIGADAVKLGMLGTAAIVDAVREALAGFAGPVVIDPVMVAKGGAPLLAEDAEQALRALLPRAAVVTPNAPELARLTGLPADTAEQALAAGNVLAHRTGAAVLVKGGHLPGETVTDVLLEGDCEHRFTGERIDTRHTHGTGCATASAIACGLAQGMTLPDAVARAHAFVAAAIRAAPGLGQGHGPLGFADGARALGI